MRSGDHFWGGRFIAESAGRGIFRNRALALGESSTRPLTGHHILGSPRVVDTATGSSGHQWMVRCHPQKRRKSSSIIPKPPPHVARLAMSPTAPADSRPPSAPCAQLVATRVRQVHELFGAMLPKWPTRLGNLVKLGEEAAPTPRGVILSSLRACGGCFACSMRVRLRGGGGSGQTISRYLTITCVS